MFEELLRNQIFTAEVLKTRIDSCLSIRTTSSREEVDKIRNMASLTGLDYDNVVIMEGNLYSRFVHRDDLGERTIDLRRIGHSFQNYKFSATDSLIVVIDKIRTDFQNSSLPFLYLIMDGSRPVGIITYADLNRRSTYVYFYILIAFVEQWLRKTIAEKYSRDRRLSPRWMHTITPSAKERLTRDSHKKGESTLSVASLSQLVHVFMKDPVFLEQREMYGSQLNNKILSVLNYLRPKIMHPTKLLVPKDKILKRLDALSKIAHQITDLIKREDFNEKNGGWPSYPQ